MIGRRKYGLILCDLSDECPDGHKPKCRLVELLDHNQDGHYESFEETRIESLEELKRAYKDISRDGINLWFYKNGNFFIDPWTGTLEWNPIPSS